MTPFTRSTLNLPKVKDFIRQVMAETGCSRSQAKDQYNRLKQDEIWVNDLYQVNIDRDTDSHGFGPEVKITHVSIKTLDKEPIRDWRHFQQIKNELVGEDVDAIELFPMESRLVDTVNQYHLWCMPPGEMIPVGWTMRAVGNHTPGMSGTQRDHEEGGTKMCPEGEHEWVKLDDPKRHNHTGTYCAKCGKVRHRVEYPH